MLLLLWLYSFFSTIITFMVADAIQIASQCPFANLQYPGPPPPMCIYAANNIRPSYAVRPATNSAYSTENSFNAIIDSLLRKYGIQTGGANGGLQTPVIDASRRYIKNVDKSAGLGDIIKCGIPPVNCLNDTTNLYYRSADGSCNNLLYPEYGMASTRYDRLLRPNSVNSISNSYGVPQSLALLPSARLLSLNLYGEQAYADQFRTMASMQWGQFVAHDLSMVTTKGSPVDCCEARGHKQCYPIPLGQGDPIAYNTGKQCLSFASGVTDAEAMCPPSGLYYKEKINMVTGYLDLSSLYGNSREQNNKVRLFKGGLLRTSYLNNQHFVPTSNFGLGDSPRNNDCGRHNECYLLPDRRNQLTPIIIVMHTLLLREHNRIATQLALINPYYNDEQLYQEARKINIGQYQKISYYDWLPLQVGNTYAYTTGLLYYPNHPSEYISDYDESVNTAPLAESSAAALRYCHTQVPGWFSLVSPNSYANQTLRLSEYTDRSNNLKLIPSERNFDALVLGLAYQLQKLSDGNVDAEIKHYFFRKEFDEYGTDLKAIDIQRGRDFNLASYNDMRAFCGLPRATYWSDFSNEISNKDIYALQRFYATPDDVELSIGGSLERHVPGAVFGPTFLCIVAKQFLRTRTGDRFFFENGNKNGGFTRGQLAELRKSTLASIFCNNANYLNDIQANVFVFPNIKNNPLLNCNQVPQIDLSKWQDTRYQ